METASVPEAEQIVDQRRSANYKPNIWKFNFLQSLPTVSYDDDSHKIQFLKLVDDVKKVFKEGNDVDDDELAQLELISSITKLGLSKYFDKEIRDVLGSISSCSIKKSDDLYAASLSFRLLRHYGYSVSEGIFMSLTDEEGKFTPGSLNMNVKATIELFEASNYGLEDEHILKEAKSISMQYLQNLNEKKFDNMLALPLQWRLEWYNVRRQIEAYENQNNILLSYSPKLLELAKLNFNRVQVIHQQDLKEVALSWWRDLGISSKLGFSRDRMVESFLLATGIAPDHQHGNLRKWLAKTIQLIVIVDDIYDIYGSLPELEKFTNAIERWNFKEVEELPECMVTCFRILDDTTNDIAHDIYKGTSCGFVLHYLRNTWADFCKALLVEARWYTEGRTPTLEEYLDNGWISSSAPLASIHIIFGVATNETLEEASQFFEASREIVYWASLIVRLCNDEGTSSAELARGDAPSSILCYMIEANVSDKSAREHIQTLIAEAWLKINTHLSTLSQEELKFVKYMVNMARIGHFMYQNGDGFGVQDRETKQEIISNLIEPFAI
ncbi:hypothetical protein LIER_15542 [Lithospermum erythrorhizon]|uniref:Uncharacterized protein n=1 Tax=Lithospermum erythrorhizon TaxID=34254 RepID=A0AAV3Q3D3_LITER